MSEVHVLMADESPTVVEMYSYILAAAGYSVEAAGDGLQALQAIFRRVPDLALLDIRMPKVNGTQACRLLKSDPATRGMPVVLLSSQEAGPDRIHAGRAGADRCLGKTAAPEEIVRAVGECLAGRTRPPDAREGGRVPDDMEIMARVNGLLESRLFEATLFNEIGRVGQEVGREVEDFETTMREMNRILLEVAPHDALAAVFSDGISLEGIIVYAFPADESVRQATRDWTKKLWEDAGVPAAPNRAKIIEFFQDGRGPRDDSRTDLYRPGVVCPIRSGEMVKGLLALFSGGRIAGAGYGSSFEALLRHGFMLMENAWLYRQIARLSVTDGLTGLYNRRHFLEHFKKEHARSVRYRVPFSVLMIDFDHFKKINDLHGHLVGDAVLREMAVVMEAIFRSTDLAARFGGEEFIVLLPETGSHEALLAAERLRQAVERRFFAAPSPLLRCTVSIGVASFDPDAPVSENDMIARADEALYDAKREGRNRACRR